MQVTCLVLLKANVAVQKKRRMPRAVVAKANVVATRKLAKKKPKVLVAAIKKLKVPVVAIRKLKVLVVAIRKLKVLVVAIRKLKVPVAATKKLKLKKTLKANVAKANAVVRKKAKPYVFV